MEPLLHLIVSLLLRGWVGGQQAHLSLGPLGLLREVPLPLSFCGAPPPQDRVSIESQRFIQTEEELVSE